MGQVKVYTGVVQVLPDGLTVTVYPVIGDPCVAGAVQLSVTVPLLTVPDAEPGASGTSRGVMLADDADAVPVPAALIATTVKVYGEP